MVKKIVKRLEKVRKGKQVVGQIVIVQKGKKIGRLFIPTGRPKERFVSIKKKRKIKRKNKR